MSVETWGKGQFYANKETGVLIFGDPKGSEISVRCPHRYEHVKNDRASLMDLDRENKAIARSLLNTQSLLNTPQKLVMVIEGSRFEIESSFINTFTVYQGYISEVTADGITVNPQQTTNLSPITTDYYIIEIIVIDEIDHKIKKALEGSCLDQGTPLSLIGLITSYYFDSEGPMEDFFK